MLKLLGLPVEASIHAAEIDRLIVLVHWLMFALFIGWGIYYVYVLFRFRAGANPKASYEGAHGTASKYVELAVVVVEALLLVVYAIPAWANRVNDVPPENEALVIRVVAEQFAWNVHYPGPDGVFGRTDVHLVSADNPIGLDRSDPSAADDITTINQLNVPVDRPVLIHLTSKDVIHSFGVYELRVKQDAIPGLEVPVWFIPTRIGQYDITCSQLCGLGHYRMRGFLNVQSAADFQAFLANPNAQ
jgi:cytochrome c oxidase subunit 2